MNTRIDNNTDGEVLPKAWL